MHAAAMRVELRIRDVSSLKQKRSVLTSLTNQLTTRFGVAVAEVDYHDKWQRASLGIATVSSGAGHLDRMLHKVRTAIAERRDVELLHYAVRHLEDPL